MEVSVIGFNREEKKITIEVKTNLFRKYFSNFEGMVLDSAKLPSDVSVSWESESLAKIKMTLSEDGAHLLEELGGGNPFGKQPEEIKEISRISTNFRFYALKKEQENVEILPIEGYSRENLKEDAIRAVKAKRDFCVMDNYESYLSQCKDHNNKFHQLHINYGSPEYCSVFLDIVSGRSLDYLRSQLKLESWD